MYRRRWCRLASMNYVDVADIRAEFWVIVFQCFPPKGRIE